MYKMAALKIGFLFKRIAHMVRKQSRSISKKLQTYLQMQPIDHLVVTIANTHKQRVTTIVVEGWHRGPT
jgi:hypothetical protein